MKKPLDKLLDEYYSTQLEWSRWCDSGNAPPPEVIDDDDAILEETFSKTGVDLQTYSDFFNPHLSRALETGEIYQPFEDRESFREQVKNLFCRHMSCTGERRVIFGGGGSASGKTTLLWHCARIGVWPSLGPGQIAGEDYVKLLIPEFSVITEVGDCRAAQTVERESQLVADELFQELIEAKASFVWDSTSNYKEIEKKVALARANGYSVQMLVVLTDVPTALIFSREHARLTRRFVGVAEIKNTHHRFRIEFPKYENLFEQVQVFVNYRGEAPLLVAEKQPIGWAARPESKSGKRLLAVHDLNLLQQFVPEWK